jgi:gas vesicle protein
VIALGWFILGCWIGAILGFLTAALLRAASTSLEDADYWQEVAWHLARQSVSARHGWIAAADKLDTARAAVDATRRAAK